MNLIDEINKLILGLYKDSSQNHLQDNPLIETNFEKNPFHQFCLWFKEATKSGIKEPYSMALATSNHQGKPSVRMILLKEIDKTGFTFFSNYQSRKGKELENNNCAAILFYWQKMGKQVRIEGKVVKLSEKESDAYFQTRPRESQLSSWASLQSSKILERNELLHHRENLRKKFADSNIPRPDFWGGYKLKPTFFEFWKRGPHRIHDRITYQLQQNGTWRIYRLAP